MVNIIYGKKVGSTQIFNNSGTAVYVTAIEAEPCTVVHVKDLDSDGYNALRVGFGSIKEKNLKNPLKGIFSKANLPARKYLKELRVDSFDREYKPGDQIDIQIFKVGDKVKISGIAKGKGFSGVIKRHNFHRGPMTHGSHSIRKTGSIGMCATPSKVHKGKKMPGRMGGKKITLPSTEIIDIIQEQNLILVKGSVPGPSGNLVLVKKV
ncbi:MAG: 50S ribosomal protein L3 [Actinobacteria bacterium]|nr:50S ribosomal protein L3 [Actinomycetota bacterium]